MSQDEGTVKKAFLTMATVAFCNLALGYAIDETGMAAAIADKLNVKSGDGSVPFWLLKIAQEASTLARKRQEVITRAVQIMVLTDDEWFEDLTQRMFGEDQP